MDGKMLGKIQNVFYGTLDGGMGLYFTLGDGSWGVQDTITSWKPSVERGKFTKWTEEERIAALYDAHKRIEALMIAVGVTDVTKLLNKPIEATFGGSVLRSWRILTEVL